MAELAAAVLPVVCAILTGSGAVLAGAGPVLITCVILKVPALAGTVVLFSGAGVLGVGFSGVAGVACPGEADAGLVRTSGTSGFFPLFMPVLLSPAPAFSEAPTLLAWAPVSGVPC
jgi:hypothetical protein